jgi:galactokinase/CTP:molybdopterin cytidylyltransferase MocA
MICSELKQAASEALSVVRSGTHAERAGRELRIIDYLIRSESSASTIRQRSLLYLFRQIYGEHKDLIAEKLTRLSNLCELFLKHYSDGPVQLLRAPARINVLGEHIDYVSYIPTASLSFGSRERDMLMMYRPSETGRVRAASTSPAYPIVAFTLNQGPSIPVDGSTEDNWLSYLYENSAPAPRWDNYVKGAVFFSHMKYGEQIQFGFDFAVDSNIPPGGGASSSSALVVLAGAAIREVNQVKVIPDELARDSAKAEWYVGTRGGAMDHTTICLARSSRAVRINYWKDQSRRVPMPADEFQWITFFSKPADKGREVMIKYNERAAVSRLFIPAVIDGWQTRQPEQYRCWLTAVEAFAAGRIESLETIQTLINELPETLTLTAIKKEYPDTFAACYRSFPALVEERLDSPLPVRDRALHHLGEVRRGLLATSILDSIERNSDVLEQTSAMRKLGVILNESHQSLRDLYGVSTPEVEHLVEIIRSDPHVYGAHLMGGGFGGNVLAVTNEEHITGLIERVQDEYYEPGKRHGVREGSVMISTPGDGLSQVCLNSVWREALEQFSQLGDIAASSRENAGVLLDTCQRDSAEVWPVIVAAGKGTRARATGLEIPKPLALISGKPSIVHVLNNLRIALGKTRPPIVIISPETESAVREALAGEDITFVLQPRALGTADAVFCAYEQMHNFSGRALVMWGTQPVIRPATIRRTLNLANLFDDYALVLPTTLKNHPYAPLQRDVKGHVQKARETHLEAAELPAFGETNIGLFVLDNRKMFAVLLALRQLYWDVSKGRYKLPSYEMGFPNQLINYLVESDAGVFACPIADAREEQGIKNFQDIDRCEQFISELQNEKDLNRAINSMGTT